MKNLDICILTAGRFDMLEKCLSAVRRELGFMPELKATVYLLDNGSTNGTLSKVNVDGIRTKRLSNNSGFPQGANELIRMGRSDDILFITDDVVVQEGFLQKAVTAFDKQKQEGFVLMGFKLVFPYNATDPTRPAGRVQHIGHSFTMRGEILHPLVGWSANHRKCCISREVGSVTGAMFMVMRKAFNKVGGFSTEYGRGTYEDVDLALKLRSVGGRIWLCADAVAEHYTGATAEQLNLPFPLEANSALFRAKWLSGGVSLVQWDDWTFR